MATPLHHTWTYQALVHDVLDFTLNRVVVQEAENDTNHQQDGHRHSHPHKAKIKTCDLNPSDKFWVSYRGSPFPTVAESIQEELEDYKASEGEVKRLKESMVYFRCPNCIAWVLYLSYLLKGLDPDGEAAMSLISNTTAKLTSAVSSLPQLLERKRLLDMHTTIATGKRFKN